VRGDCSNKKFARDRLPAQNITVERSLDRPEKKERSLLWSVHLALQHLSGARHFGQAPEV
jgi:hypothetical protein